MKWKLVPEEATAEMEGIVRGEDGFFPSTGVYSYKALVAAAPSPWVSVKDRLPEDGQKVWYCLPTVRHDAVLKKNKVHRGRYCANGHMFIGEDYSIQDSDCPYWMPYEAFPLPEDE